MSATTWINEHIAHITRITLISLFPINLHIKQQNNAFVYLFVCTRFCVAVRDNSPFSWTGPTTRVNVNATQRVRRVLCVEFLVLFQAFFPRTTPNILSSHIISASMSFMLSFEPSPHMSPVSYDPCPLSSKPHTLARSMCDLTFCTS